MDHPPLGCSFLLVVVSYDMSCALIFLTGVPSYHMSCAWILLTGLDLVEEPPYDMLNDLIFWTELYWWDSRADIYINLSSMGCGYDRALGFWIGPYAIGPHLFGGSAVVWHAMCLDYLNWALWMKFHGWYWYQSFIDRSNIWGVDGTDPFNPEMDHLPLDCSYLVEALMIYNVPLFSSLTPMREIPWLILISILHQYIQYSSCRWDRPLGFRNGQSAIGPQQFHSCAVIWSVMGLDFLNRNLCMRFHGWYWYQSCIGGSNIGVVDRTKPWGPQMDHCAEHIW